METLKICNTCSEPKAHNLFDPNNNICRKCKKQRYRVKVKATRPERHIWSVARQRATRKGLAFDITVDDIVVPDRCPYLNIQLTICTDGIVKDDTASIDRIDNEKGYVKGNIRIISFRANKMKSNLNAADLIHFANAVLKLHA